MRLTRKGSYALTTALLAFAATTAAATAPATAATTTLATPATAATSPAATASATAAFHPEPWKPYRSEPWVAPAGKYCAFSLGVEVVADDESYRVDDRYPDGTTKVEEYKGKLVIDYVREDTGARVRRNVSGRAWLEYQPDGVTWKRYTMAGPVGFGFRDQDHVAEGKGYYTLDGLHVVTFDAAGTRTMTVDLGTDENMCHTLADPAAAARRER